MKYFSLIFFLLLHLGCGQGNEKIQSNVLTSPINLAHVLALVDSLEIEGKKVMFIWIYADAPNYEPIGAPGEGITCVDDVGRFMEVLETEIIKFDNRDLIPIAAGMTRFLLHLSREDGLWYNFMLADGKINTTHQNSVAEFGWWAIRGLRGLAAAYNIFTDQPGYKPLLTKIEDRIIASEIHIKAAHANYPSEEITPLGSKPAWLVKNAPDMNSELLIALTKLHETGKFDYLDPINKISEGLLKSQFQIQGHDLNGMYFCWPSLWHNWGNNQAYALLKAYKITANTDIIVSVRDWADFFIPHLKRNDFLWDIRINDNQQYTYHKFPQIAYGMNSIYQGLKSLAELTEEPAYVLLSEDIFNWYKGQNAAKTQMYNPDTGRCFDGINSVDSVNMNSGVESTIECLIAIQRRGYFQ